MAVNQQLAEPREGEMSVASPTPVAGSANAEALASKANNSEDPAVGDISAHTAASESERQASLGLLRHPVPCDAATELVATFCDAFREDPVFAFLLRPLGGIQKRPDAYERIFHCFLRASSMQGIVRHSEGFLSSVLWFPPGTDILTNIVRTGVFWDMLRVPPVLLKRMLGDYSMKADYAKAKFFRGRPTKTCYYVQMAGTRTAHQGKGLLKHSMLPVLEKADREGAVCYLEATRKTNLPVYERFGFRVTDTFDLKDKAGTVCVYCMAREPVAKC